MALINCYECSGEMSTAATACPKCGAPNKTAISPDQPKQVPKTGFAFKFLGGVVGLLIVIGIFSSSKDSKTGRPAEAAPSSASTASQAVPGDVSLSKVDASVPPVAQPQEPAHNYAMTENGEYGYEQAISDDDKNRGIATKPLLMVRYLGTKGETQVVDMLDGPRHMVVSCEWPCQFVKVHAVVGDRVVSEQRMRNTPGSLISEVMDDAFANQLKLYKAPSNKAIPADDEE